MSTLRSSAVKVALFIFFIIASDMRMKSEARGPIERWHCSNDSECQYNCPTCGCRCIQTWCRCPNPPLTNNLRVRPPSN
ncbi:hypothetical protein VNO77_25971 [Canavalia gladiata]|uniref:Uncharacterized protein n=1 Tax=Canavalia gladiata TaxID=3824 RepID=A0AAN9KW88_CANGL